LDYGSPLGKWKPRPAAILVQREERGVRDSRVRPLPLELPFSFRYTAAMARLSVLVRFDAGTRRRSAGGAKPSYCPLWFPTRVAPKGEGVEGVEVVGQAGHTTNHLDSVFPGDHVHLPREGKKSTGYPWQKPTCTTVVALLMTKRGDNMPKGGLHHPPAKTPDPDQHIS
jgi:hypothetical protein